MKTFIHLIIFTGLSLPSYSQVWVEKDSIPAPAGFYGTFSFSIGSMLYVGGGYDGSNYLSAFYQYDPGTNSWAIMADIPSTVASTNGFVLNGMGYVACGASVFNDIDSVFMYNPGTNTWSRKNNFPGGVRENIASFSANGYGYVFGGLGGGSALNDLWQYNDTTDTWRQMASCPGPGRDAPSYMVINGEIYVGMGDNPSGTMVYPDYYHFDPIANAYTQVDSMPSPRVSTASFSIGNLGYIGLGHIFSSGAYGNDFYTFDPNSNSWAQTDSFDGEGRAGIYSGIVNGVPYLGCGTTNNNSFLFRDCWTYTSKPNGIHTALNNTTLSCYPSPANGRFTIEMSGYSNGEKQINICDQLGQTVYQTTSSQDKIQIANTFFPGLYIVSVTQDGQHGYTRVMVE